MKDKLDGFTDKVKGEAKEKAGKVLDDKKMEAEGKFDKAKGDAKEKIGDLKNKYDKKNK